MSIDNAVLSFAGFVVLVSLALGHYVSEYWLLLTAFAGLNMLQAGIHGLLPRRDDLQGVRAQGRLRIQIGARGRSSSASSSPVFAVASGERNNAVTPLTPALSPWERGQLAAAEKTSPSPIRIRLRDADTLRRKLAKASLRGGLG